MSSSKSKRVKKEKSKTKNVNDDHEGSLLPARTLKIIQAVADSPIIGQFLYLTQQ